METHEVRVLAAVEAGEKIEYTANAIYKEGQDFPMELIMDASGNKGFQLHERIPNKP